jgi:hypothetical protein
MAVIELAWPVLTVGTALPREPASSRLTLTAGMASRDDPAAPDWSTTPVASNQAAAIIFNAFTKASMTLKNRYSNPVGRGKHQPPAKALSRCRTIDNSSYRNCNRGLIGDPDLPEGSSAIVT